MLDYTVHNDSYCENCEQSNLKVIEIITKRRVSTQLCFACISMLAKELINE